MTSKKTEYVSKLELLKADLEILENDFEVIKNKLMAVLSEKDKAILADFQNKYRALCEQRLRYYDELDKDEI